MNYGIHNNIKSLCYIPVSHGIIFNFLIKLYEINITQIGNFSWNSEMM